MKTTRQKGKENMKKEPKEYIEDIEEVIVEVIKVPFKIANKVFSWIIGDED